MSSKVQMEESFEILKKINKVETPNSILENVLQRAEQSKSETISINWLRIVAALLVFMLSTEIYIIKSNSKNQQTNDSIELIPQINNMLYYE